MWKTEKYVNIDGDCKTGKASLRDCHFSLGKMEALELYKHTCICSKLSLTHAAEIRELTNSKSVETGDAN